MMIFASAVMTGIIFFSAFPLMKALGGEGEIIILGGEYLRIMTLGSVLQIFGTGLVPVIRNNGGALFSMLIMMIGFALNVIFDYIFVWVCDGSTAGAAWATLIGQAAAMIGGICYLCTRGSIKLRLPLKEIRHVAVSIVRIGLAPFGLALTPNFSLILINRFSAEYGGSQAVAVYACISYVITIIYLVLQGVGDGAQPLMSSYYGAGEYNRLRFTEKHAYIFALCLSVLSMAVLFFVKSDVGNLFGSSREVSEEVSRVFPIFLAAVPFIAVNRVTTAVFYATEKSLFSYILTYAEPFVMLILMFILPPLFGGQDMIWWSAAAARMISAAAAVILKICADRIYKVRKV